jgi:hypothetical protein
VHFFVTHGLARNKNRLCKGWDNRIVQKKPCANINKIKKKKKCKQNLFFKFWREFNKQKVKF